MSCYQYILIVLDELITAILWFFENSMFFRYGVNFPLSFWLEWLIFPWSIHIFSKLRIFDHSRVFWSYGSKRKMRFWIRLSMRKLTFSDLFENALIFLSLTTGEKMDFIAENIRLFDTIFPISEACIEFIGVVFVKV